MEAFQGGGKPAGKPLTLGRSTWAEQQKGRIGRCERGQCGREAHCLAKAWILTLGWICPSLGTPVFRDPIGRCIVSGPAGCKLSAPRLPDGYANSTLISPLYPTAHEMVTNLQRCRWLNFELQSSFKACARSHLHRKVQTFPLKEKRRRRRRFPTPRQVLQSEGLEVGLDFYILTKGEEMLTHIESLGCCLLRFSFFFFSIAFKWIQNRWIQKSAVC